MFLMKLLLGLAKFNNSVLKEISNKAVKCFLRWFTSSLLNGSAFTYLLIVNIKICILSTFLIIIKLNESASYTLNIFFRYCYKLYNCNRAFNHLLRG